ncbi:hypothetical protein RB594_001036 [Gaeumannomyces avenae]
MTAQNGLPAPAGGKPTVLHLGDPVEFGHELHAQLQERFNVVRPTLEERQRPAFLRALREGKWGDFAAVFKPFWNTGGEMGRWDRELIPLLPPSFKIYAAAGAGFDWADVDVMAERGIIYCNGAGASTEAVADMAIYHILSVFRNMQWSNMAARGGDPDAFLDAHRNAPVGARNPAGHVLGVVGLGRIGQRAAQKAHAAFGMRIAYHDVAPRSAKQTAGLGADFKGYDSLEEMLPHADCVLMAAPTQPDGKPILKRKHISMLKKGARVVNIGRGTLLDEEALADALDSGAVYSAGLDVHANEPHVSARLRAHRKVSLTSHTGGGALETTMGFEALSMQNVLAVLGGKEPLTPVNLHLFKKA